MLLVIDTCFAACSVALYARGVVASRYVAMERGHAEALPPMVAAVLRDAGQKAAAVTGVAVTIGPGSFTGTRIGLSFARGFALARALPLVGLDSLVATAAPFRGKEAVTVVQHAGASDFVFHAVYDAEGNCVAPPSLMEVGLVGGLSQSQLCLGSAAHLVLDAKHDPRFDLPDAAKFAFYADTLERLKTPPDPLYLREPDAKPQAALALKPMVRLFTADDLPLLARLHATSFDAPWSMAQFADVLALPGASALVVTCDGAVRGFVQFQAILDEAEIHTVCVEPRWRKRGLAGILLASLKEMLRAQNISAVFLDVAHTNVAALKLYERVGFIPVGRRKNYYASIGADAVLMRCNLS